MEYLGTVLPILETYIGDSVFLTLQEDIRMRITFFHFNPLPLPGRKKKKKGKGHI